MTVSDLDIWRAAHMLDKAARRGGRDRGREDDRMSLWNARTGRPLRLAADQTGDHRTTGSAYGAGALTTRVSGGRLSPRKIYIDGRETSVRLEPIMWEAPGELAQ